jgi:hypothetical protein
MHEQQAAAAAQAGCLVAITRLANDVNQAERIISALELALQNATQRADAAEKELAELKKAPPAKRAK